MNYIITYLVYLFFGVLPSLLWLYYYLKKDKNPEPRLLLFRIFILGALITIPTVFAQKIVFNQFKAVYFNSALFFLWSILFVMALIEEIAKFLVIKFQILNHPEFDEPVDAMIYMVTSSLGFAAAENFLTLVYSANENFLNESFLISEEIIWTSVIQISLIRFIGATFLHALCGAIVGFFVGFFLFKKRKKKLILIPALLIAGFLHALYNFFIMNIDTKLGLISLFFLLIALYFTVSLLFKNIKNEK